MAKEQDGSPKPRHPEFQRMRVTLTIGVIGLCVTSYILGAWQGTSNSIKPSFIRTKTRCDNLVRSSGTLLDFQAHHQVSFNEPALGKILLGKISFVLHFYSLHVKCLLIAAAHPD